jgi:hypothetical protein
MIVIYSDKVLKSRQALRLIQKIEATKKAEGVVRYAGREWHWKYGSPTVISEL